MPSWPELDEAERTILLRDLSRVGPGKPVGYLPLYTLQDIVQVVPENAAAAANALGLTAVQFSEEACCIKSGAFYVYHRTALNALLQAQTDILAAEGLPLDPDQFVAHIAKVWLEPSHPAYAIVAAAFGNIA